VGEKGVTVQVRDEVEARDMSGLPPIPLEQSSGWLAKLWIGLGIVFAVLALGFLPPLFGSLGILFGYLARRRGSRAGGVATMYISGSAMVLGMIFGVLVAVFS
jgi:purine-cytosine permease-like protein